jgi:hypothetical protein
VGEGNGGVGGGRGREGGEGEEDRILALFCYYRHRGVGGAHFSHVLMKE